VAEIMSGNRVTVRTADKRQVARIAVTGIVEGGDFPVVWVCREQEWSASQREQRAPQGLPWPATDVRLEVG